MLGFRNALWPRLLPVAARHYRVLAIETSCDDTCVAILDRYDVNKPPRVVVELKQTLDSAAEGGIIPTRAHVHHQMNLAPLIGHALKKTGLRDSIDFVCATRGPGMPGSLSGGLDLAKGLAVAWDVPFIGMHHMLGHLLMARMSQNKFPSFPLVSLLVSGGHTVLVHSTDAVTHRILCDSIDIAAGDSLDKCGRELGIHGTMIAKEMEHFIDSGPVDLMAVPMSLPNPLHNKPKESVFSYAPFITAVRNNRNKPIQDYSQDEKRSMAYQIQNSIFTHTATKIKHALRMNSDTIKNTTTFVCSGGVSANKHLRKILESELKSTFQHFHYPPPTYTSDNAVMIGWAAIELLEAANLTTNIDVLPLRKWKLPDLLQVDGWSTSTKKDVINI